MEAPRPFPNLTPKAGTAPAGTSPVRNLLQRGPKTCRPLYCSTAPIRCRTDVLRFTTGSILRLASADSSTSNLPLSRANREFAHELLDLRYIGRRIFHRRAGQPGCGSIFWTIFPRSLSNAVTAAEELGSGEHPMLPCAPETGKSLRVPSSVHNWKFTRA